MHSRNIIGSGNLKHVQGVYIDEHVHNSHDLY